MGLCTFLQTTDSIIVLQIKSSLINLQINDIKMLDLKLYVTLCFVVKIKKFGSKYNTLEVCDWSQSCM